MGCMGLLRLSKILLCLYRGYQNQQIIEVLPGWEENYPAFLAAKNYSHEMNGKIYNDWFLASSFELSLVYAARGAINTTALMYGGEELLDKGKETYWSSREYECISGSAWDLDFFFGSQTSSIRSFPSAVRCVRAF